jgi:hypothetical protein
MLHLLTTGRGTCETSINVRNTRFRGQTGQPLHPQLVRQTLIKRGESGPSSESRYYCALLRNEVYVELLNAFEKVVRTRTALAKSLPLGLRKNAAIRRCR